MSSGSFEPPPSRSRPFQPDAGTRARLAEDLSRPDMTLREIAQRYNTCLEHLSLYLLSEPALAYVAALEAAAAARIRLAATSHLDRAVEAAVSMLDTYEVDSDRLQADTPRNRIFRETQRSNARRAANLLYRLARFRPITVHLAPSDQASLHAPHAPHAHDESASRGVQPEASPPAAAPVQPARALRPSSVPPPPAHPPRPISHVSSTPSEPRSHDPFSPSATAVTIRARSGLVPSASPRAAPS